MTTVRKIVLKDKNKQLIENLDNCAGFQLEANEIDVEFESVELVDLKSWIDQHLDFEGGKYGSTLKNTFSVLDVKREILTTLLASNSEANSFRIFIGSEQSSHSQDDFTLIMFPITKVGLEDLTVNAAIASCQRPPGCTIAKSHLLDDNQLRDMFDKG